MNATVGVRHGVLIQIFSTNTSFYRHRCQVDGFDFAMFMGSRGRSLQNGDLDSLCVAATQPMFQHQTVKSPNKGMLYIVFKTF